MNVLCLSLGHNSSAVYVTDTGEVIGYETERLTRVKSDSKFPIVPIRRIMMETEVNPDVIYISHWFDNFDAYTTESKYYSASMIYELFPHATLKACQAHVNSHHDAHAFSAHAFAGKEFVTNSTLTVVVDGFGNGQEVASAYRGDRLTSRIVGYFHSMGLLYQHAAEACGMDGMNDVYKFLGYRVHILQQDLELCNKVAKSIINIMRPAWDHFGVNDPIRHPKDIIDYDEFFYVKEHHKNLFLPLLDQKDTYYSRVRVGYVVQEVLEYCVLQFIKKQLSFDNLILAGGCFLNVRLNDKIRQAYPQAKVCVMPLAGDQGAALGLAYRSAGLPKRIFDSLCWGLREFEVIDDEHITRVPFNEISIGQICDDIANGYIVNLCYGAMEFGPRALCHTSSLALPTRHLIDAINEANGRTTVMPMAPVMLYRTGHKYFDARDVERTHKSDRFMITAHNYKPSTVIKTVEGVAHEDIDGSFSGRPQFVDPDEGVIGPILQTLESEHGIDVLVNTSLNIHGEPIVYDMSSLMVTTSHWLEHCPVRFKTYVVEERDDIR